MGPNARRLPVATPSHSLPMIDRQYPEPFAFIAWDSHGKTYVAFRGCETSADFWEDAAVDQVSYDPIVPGFGLVHDGFHDVYPTSCRGSLPAFPSPFPHSLHLLTST